MLVKIEARILIFPGTDFHFPSTSVPPGTFLKALFAGVLNVGRRLMRCQVARIDDRFLYSAAKPAFNAVFVVVVGGQTCTISCQIFPAFNAPKIIKIC